MSKLVMIALAVAGVLSMSPSGSAQVKAVDITSIKGRVEHALAYDPVRERVVLFGGETRRGAAGPGNADTWEWDGSTWRHRTPAHSPPARKGHAMVYDTVRRRVVLFGGLGLSDTWEWDGVDWRQRLPAHSPPPRFGVAMAYDESRRRVVLFGGWNKSGYLGDTWEWDGRDWLQRKPKHSPPVRFSHGMAYDAARREVVLFGGSGTWALGDTWVWNGSDWTKRSPTVSPGEGKRGMAFDRLRKRIVLLHPSGTWEWDGSNWKSIGATRKPRAVDQTELVYDIARREVVMFGGATRGYILGPKMLDPDETWGWDGTNWTLRHRGHGYETSMRSAAYDTTRNVLVSFSSYFLGYTGPCKVKYDPSTREWNGSAWRSTNKGPSRREGQAMAYDAGRAVTVLFGGFVPTNCSRTLLADTWEWNGKDWRSRKTTVQPSGRFGHVLSYDAKRRRTVLFGGGRDTWEWDGTIWRELKPSVAPAARTGHAMAYDLVGARTVLNGGDGGLADTWTWSGVTWKQIASAKTPPAGKRAMGWDPTRKKVVLYVADQLWALDGNNWKRIASGLPQSEGGNLAYDTVRKALIVTDAKRTRLIGNVAPPSVQAIGIGCAGSAGVPVLTSGVPRLGELRHALAIDGAHARALTLLAVSDTQKTVPLGGGCNLYLGGSILAFATRSSNHGHAEVKLSIPFNLSLRGLTFFAQAAVIDPKTNRLSMSHALRLVIGD
jgi:Galactose oxidase, central domain